MNGVNGIGINLNNKTPIILKTTKIISNLFSQRKTNPRINIIELKKPQKGAFNLLFR
jgi:hypothetical protein